MSNGDALEAEGLPQGREEPLSYDVEALVQ